MAFLFDNRQRRGLINVTNALQRWVEDPGQLSLERSQRYNDPPPPYPSSGETTQPASPAEASVSNEDALQARRRAKFRSFPASQFGSQTSRERERIIYQVEEERYGRKQTLPYDDTADLRANAENNVRARWIEQGIWKEEWGPAWPKGAEPSDNRWRYSRQNPGGPHPCGRWGHEKRPEPRVPQDPETNPTKPNQKDVFIEWARELNSTTEESGHAAASDVADEPAATAERDTSASRPYRQFLFQVSKEREWVEDELQFKRVPGSIDLDAMAYESTKKNWIKDEIWNPTWGELPGTTWMHEDLEDEEEEERRTSKPQPDAVSNDEHQPRLPSPKSINSEPTSDVRHDGANSKNMATVPEDADTPSRVIARAGQKRKRTNGTSRLPTVNESLRSADQSADRVLRSVRSSKVRKPSESRSTRFPKQDYGMAKPKRKLERQLNARTENATLQSTSAEALNNPRKRRATVDDEPNATKGPRRSKRIAAQTRKYPS